MKRVMLFAWLYLGFTSAVFAALDVQFMQGIGETRYQRIESESVERS